MGYQKGFPNNLGTPCQWPPLTKVPGVQYVFKYPKKASVWKNASLKNAHLLNLYLYDHTITFKNSHILNCTTIGMKNGWLEMIPSQTECWGIYLKRVHSHTTASMEVHMHTCTCTVNQFKQLRSLFVSEANALYHFIPQTMLYTSCML